MFTLARDFGGGLSGPCIFFFSIFPLRPFFAGAGNEFGVADAS